MAVVQISRIQLRRGKENSGSGLPQLASGELAWAIDTQKLYIGNGAVGEGAPAVGNTQILTAVDNLLDYGTYVYKDGDSLIQTGDDVNYPIVRTLQNKLDDYVSSADYGIIPLAENDNATDQTADIQRAITNLFLDTVGNVTKARVVLTFQPGRYRFENTIYIPSYVRIEGAGKDHTIFNYTGNDAAFAFVNDTSTNGDYNGTWGSGVDDVTRYNQQSKFCYLSGFTLNTTENVAVGFQLTAVRDSVFEDIAIAGQFNATNATTAAVYNNPGIDNTGIALYAFSWGVTCQRNIFNNVYVKGFEYSVYSKHDIVNNKFSNCEITDGKFGFHLGVDSDQSSDGEEYGPRHTIIENCYFENIHRQGIYVGFGSGNRSRSNTFVDVGNNGGGNATGLYNVITFTSTGNSSIQDKFDRSNDLDSALDLAAHNFSNAYKKEVSGKVYFQELETKTVTLIHSPSTLSNLIRLPYTDSTGFEINYILESQTAAQMRKGKLLISYDSDSNTAQLVDDYEYTGSIGGDTSINFAVSTTSVANCIMIQYYNTNTLDTTLLPSIMTYTYKTLS